MNILVTGATGYIGEKMVRALCGQQWVDTVVGMGNHPPSFKHAKYRFVIRDIRHCLDDIFEAHNIHQVVHTAYVLSPIHDDKRMESINKGGTNNILAAASKAGIRQILYTSSTTAYGFHPDNDAPLTEESPLRGNDDFVYAKNKKEIEVIFKEFVAAHPHIAVSIVRPCFVVGPGFKNPLAEHLQKKFVILPSKTRPLQFVHENDLINLMVLLLENQMAGTFNVTARGTITFPEMVHLLGNIRIPVPWWVLYPLNHLAWLLRMSFATRIPSPGLRLMVHPWIASSEKIVQATGYRFAFDTQSAFMDFVASLKK